MEKEIIWQEPNTGRTVWPLAVKKGQYLFLSGQFPIDPKTGRLITSYEDIPAEARWLQTGSLLTDGQEARMAAQIWFLYNRIGGVLRSLGSSPEDILLITGWLADFREWPIMNRIRGGFFPPTAYPPSTTFGIAQLPFPGARVQFETFALAKGAMKKESVGSGHQVGHYFPGGKAGPFIFLAGEVAAAPEAGLIVRGYEDLDAEGQKLASGFIGPDGWEGLIRAQSWFIYQRLKRLLENSGSSLQHVVKQTIYIHDPRDYPALEGISRLIFGDRLPPTTVVRVDEYGHRAFVLEIELTAVVKGTMELKRVETSRLPAWGPGIPFAVRAEPFLFMSGQLPIDPTRESIVSAIHAYDAKSELAGLQTIQVYENLRTLLNEQGLDMSSIVRQVIYVEDPAIIPPVEKVAAAMTCKSPPVTTFVPVRSIWPSPALVQIDFTGMI